MSVIVNVDNIEAVKDFGKAMVWPITVSDYYDKIRIPTTFTNNNHGWNHENLWIIDPANNKEDK